MEPLKPETKMRILESKPEADPADIEEYERLLSERFAVDPDLAPQPQAKEMVTARDREHRLAELYHKLFSK